MLYLCVGLEHEEKEQTKPFGFATVHAIQKVASSVIDSLGRQTLDADDLTNTQPPVIAG